ncbi:cytochrome c class I [Fibrella aestuarina BUZ 2]|uniref:Cytochrome c class I n=1 Tax=Fibrella aestuarina BUZ 2 TaxID=1166018 RepID=I0K4M9_9BACT|nr:cytochrome c [Fibrella aestuarina]CCG99082.1 cytochrome c class I [Fibrella aestuarina BUZ 2]
MKFKHIALPTIGFAVALLMTACGDDHNSTGVQYAPQMYDPVGYEAYKQIDSNRINPYGLNMRDPARGTVSRRNYHTTFGKGDSAVTDLMVYNIPKDSIGIAERTLSNPIPATEATLEEGKVLYGRYCVHCHGEGGKGDGLVGKMYAGVPNYSADAYKTMNDGHIFHVITHGKGRMWPHGSQMTPEERWKIVMYVHKLQQG